MVLIVLLVLTSIILTVFAIEAVMAGRDMYRPWQRYYVGERDNRANPNFVADPDIGWRMRPNHVFSWRRGSRTVYRGDHHGFRTGKVKVPEFSSRRISVIGDSFMWGTGVSFEKTIGQVMAASLDSTVVDNLAMPGFGVDQIWRSLVHHALPRLPDLVVVGLFTDDFNRSFSAYRWVEQFNKPTYILKGGRLSEMTREDTPGSVYRWLERRSHVFTFVRHVDRWAGLYHGIGVWWSLNAAMLDAMRDACEAAGVPILFIHIPYKSGVPFPSLQTYMNRHNAHYIDLNAHFTPFRQRSFYFKTDGHLNAEGHAFVGRLIVEWIRQT
mgnify:CR=1 FL=1